MKILVTGFEPFDGETINPSWEAVRRLGGQAGGAELVTRRLPTAFALCGPALEAALESCRPNAVLCVGQAGGRASVTVERVAVNLMDARMPDNAGAQPVDEPVCPHGPAAYFASLPVKAMVQRVRAAGIPCHLSYSAGAYVCNCVMYQALHLAAVRYPGLRAGFVHVPFLDEQAAAKPAGTPSASLAVVLRALTLALEAVADSMGTVC